MRMSSNTLPSDGPDSERVHLREVREPVQHEGRPDRKGAARVGDEMGLATRLGERLEHGADHRLGALVRGEGQGCGVERGQGRHARGHST